MPKIIFTSRFLSSVKPGSLLRYIATRDGVEGLVHYYAERPGAERSAASHGLWNGGDQPVSLSRAADEVTNHKGPVWTHVVSLRRADAERMGYVTAEVWRDLVKSKLPVIAEAMKIPMDELRWYAAYHNKVTNPHIHMICFSANPAHGYLTEPGIEKMRSAFAAEIYKNELLHVYEQKDVARAQVNQFAGDRLRDLMEQIQQGGYDHVLAQQLAALSDKLKSVSGKKQYGYLRPDVKSIVDGIATWLAADPRVDEMYKHWCELNAEIRRTYTNEIPEPVALTDEKTFRTIKNMIVRCAADMAEPIQPRHQSAANEQTEEPEPIQTQHRPEADGQTETPETVGDDAPEISQVTASLPHDHYGNDAQHQTPAPLISPAAGLLMQLARMIQQDYENRRKAFEYAVDRKLMQKTRHKQQDLGQKLE